MVFQFEHTSLTDGKYGKWSADRTDLVKLKEVLNRWQNGLRETSWNCLFWGNHDQPRAVSKFGCDLPEYRVLSAKMLCACLYLMQGTPYIYQGEEIGMPNPHFTSLEQAGTMQERRCSGIPVFAPAFQVRRHGYPWGIVGERSMSNRRRRMKIQSCTSTGIYWPSEKGIL